MYSPRRGVFGLSSALRLKRACPTTPPFVLKRKEEVCCLESHLFGLVLVVVVDRVVPADFVMVSTFRGSLATFSRASLKRWRGGGFGRDRDRDTYKAVYLWFLLAICIQVGEGQKGIPCHRRQTGSCGCGCSGRGTRRAPQEGACATSAPNARSRGCRRSGRRGGGREVRRCSGCQPTSFPSNCPSARWVCWHRSARNHICNGSPNLPSLSVLADWGTSSDRRHGRRTDGLTKTTHREERGGTGKAY